jgi:hypothetical protein
MVVRLLMVSNGLVLVAVGCLCFAYVQPDAGYWFAALAWLSAGLLMGGSRFMDPSRSDPYQVERRRRRRHSVL